VANDDHALEEAAKEAVWLTQTAANDAARILAGEATVDTLIKHYLRNRTEVRSGTKRTVVLLALWQDAAPTARRAALLAATWMGRANPLPEVTQPTIHQLAEEFQRLAREFDGRQEEFLPKSPDQVLAHPAAVLALSVALGSERQEQEIDRVAVLLMLATAACHNC
jgi:hypothetical protein